MVFYPSVTLFTEGGGVCIKGGGLHPGGSASRNPQRLGPPWTPPHRILQDTTNELAVRVLLECILVTDVSKDFILHLIIEFWAEYVTDPFVLK